MTSQKLRKYALRFIAILAIGLPLSGLVSWLAADAFFRLMGDWNASSAAGQWAGAVVTLAGFALVIFQLQHDREELEKHTEELAGQTTWMAYSNGLTTLNIFVEHPELRPYFYDGNIDPPAADDPSGQRLRNQIFATAEILADHCESTFLAGKMNSDASELWRAYMINLYCKSPALREFLHCDVEGYRYSARFRDLLEDGYRAQMAKQDDAAQSVAG